MQAQLTRGNKMFEPFRFFRVFRGQKRFIYPQNTLKDAKISKTKIGWFVSPQHDQADWLLGTTALRTAHATTEDFLNQEARKWGSGGRDEFLIASPRSSTREPRALPNPQILGIRKRGKFLRSCFPY